MKKKLAKPLACCLAAVSALSFAACGDDYVKLGDKEVGDRVQIVFQCDNIAVEKSAWEALVAAYNDGVGYDVDHVYVNYEPGTAAASKHFSKSADEAYNVMMLDDSAKTSGSFVLYASERHSKRAPNGYLVDLSSYAAADNDFKNSSIPESVMNWWRFTRNANAAQGAGAPKHTIGKGQNLLAVPIGSNPHFNWYNEAVFKAQGINIVSVPEENLSDNNAET